MKKVLESYIISIVYIIVACFIVVLPNYIFRDRDSYVYYAAFSDELMHDYSRNGIDILLVNEPLFLLINRFLSLFISPYSIPVFFTIFSFTIFFYFLQKSSKNILMIFFGLTLYFTITYTFHLQFVILRQSIATSFFLIVLYYVKDIKILLLACIILGFIHSSFFFIFILLVINYFSNKLIKREVFSILFQSLFFFTLGYVSLVVASYIGFRQAEGLLDAEVSIGGGSWILWLLVTMYLIFWGDRTNKFLYNYTIVGMISFLSLYFSTPFIGRLVASFIPAIILIIVSKFRAIDFIVVFLILIPYTYLLFNGVLFDLSFAVNSHELSVARFFDNFWY